MNKKFPYEDAFERQMNNLPLPSEDASWEQMKNLLDEKDRRRPAAYLIFYPRLVYLLLFVLGTGSLVYSLKHATEEPTAPTALQPDSRNSKPYSAASSDAAAKHLVSGGRKKTNDVGLVQELLSNKVQKKKSPQIQYEASRRVETGYKPSVGSLQHGLIKSTMSKKKNTAPVTVSLKKSNASSVFHDQTVEHIGDSMHLPINETEATTLHVQLSSLASAVHVADIVSAPDKPGTAETTIRITAHPEKEFFVDAGIGVQQQVPVGGQQLYAYGLSSQKNFVSDYIPSVFVRLENKARWFVQAEFSYAAPQLVKKFAYSKRTEINTPFVTTTSLYLQKMYYNQVPLSFNYYINPHWSAGGGAVYSWYHGAVTEQETVMQDLSTHTTFTERRIIPIHHYTDSFLYRSQTYVLVQSSYQWRGLSVGLRYTKNTQPFIKYTLPDGTVTDRSNWAVEGLLRLTLWKSSRF